MIGEMLFNQEAVGGEATAFWSENKRKRGGELEEALGLLSEPRSVLDRHRSPSPPTSSSTRSSSLGGSEKWPMVSPNFRDEWPAADLPPIPASLGCGLEDWDAVLSDPPPPQSAASAQDQTFLGWIMGEVDNDSGTKHPVFQNSADLCGILDHSLPGLGNNSAELNLVVSQPISLPQVSLSHDGLMANVLLNQHQLQIQAQNNPSFFDSFPSFSARQECQLPPPVSLLVPPLKRQAVEPPGPEFFVRGIQPQVNFQQRHTKPRLDESVGIAQQQQQQLQGLVDQLFKAAELVGCGNSVSARGILARLNHQLLSPVGKPLLRTAFYFKEALQLVAIGSPCRFPSPSTTPKTPMDVVLKLHTYKTFSDVSPIVQFTNFTCIQALLEEIGSAARIHIIDFDIGIGGQWSALMQELAQRCSGSAAAPLLKITAFVSPGCCHPLEMHLTRENLCHFATELNIPFEFNILSLDPFDPALFLNMSSGNDEVVAVNLPVNSAVYPPMKTLLPFVKQLKPKIVISVDNGFDRSDLPFAHHFLHVFQSCTVLLDSVDAAGANQDTISKIERFIVQPRIENSVIGRHQASEKTLPWKSLFASNGFSPVQFSNFTETQAECLLKRVQVRGFHVEKRQASLSLCWQRGELVSISAWSC